MITRFVVILFTMFWISCSKKGGQDDNTSPVIQLSSPANNQTFIAGQTVTISGNIIDENEIAEVHFHISNFTTGQLLIDIHRYPQSAIYSVNETFQAQAATSYRIQVVAVDKFANQRVSAVQVSGN